MTCRTVTDRVDVTDEMVERAHAAYWRSWHSKGMAHDAWPSPNLDGDSNMRKALEAALDRRTGPKCRREKQSDPLREHSRAGETIYVHFHRRKGDPA